MHFWLFVIIPAAGLSFMFYLLLDRSVESAVAKVWLASFLTAVVVAAGMQLVGYLHDGYLDMFWPIAVFTAGSVSLLTALIVLSVWRASLRKDDEQ
jgi:hypothetical protein